MAWNHWRNAKGFRVWCSEWMVIINYSFLHFVCVCVCFIYYFSLCLLPRVHGAVGSLINCAYCYLSAFLVHYYGNVSVYTQPAFYSFRQGALASHLITMSFPYWVEHQSFESIYQYLLSSDLFDFVVCICNLQKVSLSIRLSLICYYWFWVLGSK